MDKKVYCINCLSLKRTRIDECRAPGNILRYTETNWLKKIVGVKLETHPSILNAKNDCGWYAEKVKQMTQVELVVDVLKKNEERLSDGYGYYTDEKVDEALKEIAEEIFEDLEVWGF